MKTKKITQRAFDTNHYNKKDLKNIHSLAKRLFFAIIFG